MSEYFLNNIESVKKVSRVEWLDEAYLALEKIRIGEDYLFFKMKEPISDELKYYRKNVSELGEIITILDETYAVCGYHQILDCIIETEEAILKGNNLEHLILKEETMIDGVIEESVAFYAFPEGTLESIKEKRKKELFNDKKRSEGMYL